MIVVSDKLTTESFHAFIDEQLSEEQYARVESLLDELPDKIQEIQQCQTVNERLREVFDASVQEAIPDDLYQLAVHGVLPDSLERPDPLSIDNDNDNDDFADAESSFSEFSVTNNNRQVTAPIQDEDEFADLVALSAGKNLDDFDIDAIAPIASGEQAIVTDIFDESMSGGPPGAPGKGGFELTPKASSFAEDKQTLQFMDELELDFVGIDDDTVTVSHDDLSSETPVAAERAVPHASQKKTTAKRAIFNKISERPPSKTVTDNLASPDVAPFVELLTEDMSLAPLESPLTMGGEPSGTDPTPLSNDVAREALLTESPLQTKVFETLVPTDALELSPLSGRQDTKTFPPQRALFKKADKTTITFRPDELVQPPISLPSGEAGGELRGERLYRNLASENRPAASPATAVDLPASPMGGSGGATDTDDEWQKVIDEINSHAANIGTTGSRIMGRQGIPNARISGLDPSNVESGYSFGNGTDKLSERNELPPGVVDAIDNANVNALQQEAENIDLFSDEGVAEHAIEINKDIKSFDHPGEGKPKFTADEQLFSSVSSRISEKVKVGMQLLSPARLRHHLKKSAAKNLRNRLPEGAQSKKPVNVRQQRVAQKTPGNLAAKETLPKQTLPKQALNKQALNKQTLKKPLKQGLKQAATDRDSLAPKAGTTSVAKHGGTVDQLQVEFEQFQRKEFDKIQKGSARQKQKKPRSNVNQREGQQAVPVKPAHEDGVQLHAEPLGSRMMEQWTQRLLGYIPAAKRNRLGAAAIALVLVGVVIGAMLAGLAGNSMSGVSHEGIQKLAVEAHVLYTQQDQDFVGESRTSITESLQWFSARLGKPVRLADLSVKGFKHKNTIIIPTIASYATVNLYENTKRQKMSLVVAASASGASDTPLKCYMPSSAEGLCSWTKDTVHYVVVASLSLTRVREFSQAIVEQL